MKTALLVLLFLALTLVVGSIWADHMPDAFLSPGEPERVLADIPLGRPVPRARLMTTRGEPTLISEGPAGQAVREFRYEWTTGRTALRASGCILPAGAGKDVTLEVEDVSAVALDPAHFDDWARTGRGVGLGDSADKLRAMYGPLRKEWKGLPSFPDDCAPCTKVWYSWASEEYSLIAQVDASGRIVHLWAVAPE